MTLADAIDLFVEAWGLERSLETVTIKQYRHQLRMMIRPLLDLPMRAIATEHLLPVISDFRKKVAVTTWASCLSPLRLLSRWAYEEGLWPQDYTRRFRGPVLPRRLPRFIENPQGVMDMAARLDPLTPFGIRDRAMLLTQYSGALRISELLALTRRDYLPSQEPPLLHVRSKKRENERYVILFPEAHTSVDHYLNIARPMLIKPNKQDPGLLFLGNAGGKVSPDYWEDMLPPLGEAAGIPLRVHPMSSVTLWLPTWPGPRR